MSVGVFDNVRYLNMHQPLPCELRHNHFAIYHEATLRRLFSLLIGIITSS